MPNRLSRDLVLVGTLQTDGDITVGGKIGGGLTAGGVVTATPQSVPTGGANVVSYLIDGTAAGLNGTALTLNAATPGGAGQDLTLIVTTRAATSVTITFGTNFRSTGTLLTGTVAAKVFSVVWVSDGTAWYEVSRSTAV